MYRLYWQAKRSLFVYAIYSFRVLCWCCCCGLVVAIVVAFVVDFVVDDDFGVVVVAVVSNFIISY